ncbi:MAG: hypothetical protein A2V88_13750 [Elusimicrobia bacterium RBG_16_66_12]|nr:MAG: hypothetical protein A2V88_13750 [Elusimicrobia bacterium RBG_16_66_12]
MSKWYADAVEIIFPLVLIIASSSCRRDSIEVRQVPKETASPMAMPPDGSMPSGMIDAPPPASGVSWTAPAGWKEEPGNGIRLATFVPPQDPGKSEATVVALPGEAGGELANVNRWRGQIGLAPIDAVVLTAARQGVKSRLGTVVVYDFTGEGTNRSRIVAGLIQVGGTTWYFKLMGDEKAVGKNKAAFIKLLEGLQKDAS